MGFANRAGFARVSACPFHKTTRPRFSVHVKNVNANASHSQSGAFLFGEMEQNKLTAENPENPKIFSLSALRVSEQWGEGRGEVLFAFSAVK